MAIPPLTKAIIRFLDINPRKPHKFDIRPSNEVCKIIAKDLGLLSLTKLRLLGNLTAHGENSWRLNAHIGATVEQACVLTLASVQTRIDSTVERNYLPLKIHDESSIGLDGEVQMEQDENLEPLETELDLIAVMIEALAIELPTYPKVDGASFKRKAITAPGIVPLSDEDANPFANLSTLMKKLSKQT